MAVISGKLARVRYSAATPTSSTNQACTLQSLPGADTGGVNLQINATGRRRWDYGSTVRVYGTSTSVKYGSSLYSIDWPIGRVRFRTAKSTAVTYTLDVPWCAMSYLTQCHQWQLETNVDMLDVTSFTTVSTGASFRTFIPGLSDANVTLSRFGETSATGPLMVDRALLNNDFVLELILNSTDQAQYVCYGHIAGLAETDDVGAVVTEQVTFKPSGEVYYTT